LVSILAVGEGWHNWHHKYPFDYAASELGVLAQYNPTKLFIDTCAKLGLVWNRRRRPIKRHFNPILTQMNAVLMQINLILRRLTRRGHKLWYQSAVSKAIVAERLTQPAKAD